MTNPLAQAVYKLNLFKNFIFRPLTVGVRGIVLNADGQLLLVKHTYLTGWYLPGGKVDKGETLQGAIKRELQEELALSDVVIKDIHWAYSSVMEYKNDHIVLFMCQTKQAPQIASHEIEAVQFFPVDELPHDMTPATKRRVKEFLDGVEKPEKW